MRTIFALAVLTVSATAGATPVLAQSGGANSDSTHLGGDAVLDSSTAVGFVSTTNPERARHFYGEVLGLAISEDDYAVVAKIGSAQLRITTVPEFTPNDAPVFGFNVADVPSAAAQLRAKGVEPVLYSFLGEAQDAEGIWTAPDGSKLFWFKDPDGNLLVLGTR